jgi:hypothetical protein
MGALAVLSASCASSTPASAKGPGAASRGRPVALVYRGPASCRGCSGAVVALLAGAPSKFRPVYCGPKEAVPLSARNLAQAVVYAHPGGGDLRPAWEHMRAHADDIRRFVGDGGCYLGFCLGGYLAGASPGFDLLPGDTDEYITLPSATVHSTADTVVTVRWRGRRRHMYFQDGPFFRLHPHAAATVLATYAGGEPAAVIARYGSGRVGVVGPHPEADTSWYTDQALTNPDGIRFDLGNDLIETTYTSQHPAQSRKPVSQPAHPT